MKENAATELRGLPPAKRFKSVSQTGNENALRSSKVQADLEGDIPRRDRQNLTDADVKSERQVSSEIVEQTGNGRISAELAHSDVGVPRLPVTEVKQNDDGAFIVGKKRTNEALKAERNNESNAVARETSDRINGPRRESTGDDHSLDPSVIEALENLYSKGMFLPRDIDSRILDYLKGLSPEIALSAVEELERRDFSSVRNKPAFIMSNLKRATLQRGSYARSERGGHQPTSRYRDYSSPTTSDHSQQPQQYQTTPTCVPPSALAHLPPAVADMLQRVFASGVCHPSQFDDRAMDILVKMPEHGAVRALSDFAMVDPNRVRNPSAFWMGLARKHRDSTTGPSAMYGSSAGYASGPYNGTPMYDSLGYEQSHMGMDYSRVDQRIDELVSMRYLRPDAVDSRARDALLRMPEDDALSVLEEVVRDPGRVRNMSAYIMGLCRRVVRGEVYGGIARGPSRYGESIPQSEYTSHRTSAEPTALDNLAPAVRDRYTRMIAAGLLYENSLDSRALEALKTLRVENACAALDELAASDPTRINNVSAYFMGLARKFSG
eukprot:Plantae.Rhodophyta-Hildenbrandia_rubra.ctg6349.p2 GENE.Plantae.Rhodophyta-Hildenbrandia_rubra.ctg6349~~Plantae.Rhodophyta-Hildenbrandia_rubra.ctg6349.p2  ORF type:complete len:551 (+),score=84.41 Plantae.Rhodophyta-Hildenbrandia_rubra.ctg6349:2948-4600(+)